MTPEQKIIYFNQLKRLAKIIQKRVAAEMQKAKFLGVYESYDSLQHFTEKYENNFIALSQQLEQPNLVTLDLENIITHLENIITQLRDIEISLQRERFEEEQDGNIGYYEIVLAKHLTRVNNAFPEDTTPHLRPWEDTLLPDAAGPVGGKKKKTKKTRKNIRRSNKKTRKH
tara:strand:- start:79 stop:591 length:513 start_codon:yes stop_codon:yes gene_type:complete